MNVKSLSTPPISAVDTRLKTDVKSEVKSQESSEREADGRRNNDGNQPDRRMTEEELAEVIKVIEEMPGVKTHSLLVELADENFSPVVWLKDPSGRIIKRLTQDQLWGILQRPDKSKGQIFDRAI